MKAIVQTEIRSIYCSWWGWPVGDESCGVLC